tara:strand:- start:523 stop:1560 length:1038 start_codon:yes stop_codon:yes gene_type:complete
MINNHMKGKTMNRSKMIAASALATVMTAGAAHAEMSISGLYAGTFYDGTSATSHVESTNSVYVSYSDSLDNGMGISVAMSMSAGGANKTDVNIDTGMGTLHLGDGVDSAVDSMDGSPAVFSINPYGPRLDNSTTADFNDGDASSGMSIGYTSPSINGFNIRVTRGMEVANANGTAGTCINEAGVTRAVDAITTCGTTSTRLSGSDAVEGLDPVMSYAIKGSVMGLGVAAGVSTINNQGSTADTDPSFVTLSYSIAGLNLGYAFYDSDNATTNQEETQMGVSADVMGMTAGITFSEEDTATTDTDYMLVSLTKGMGAASFGIDYLETDASNADAYDTFAFTYVVGF